MLASIHTSGNPHHLYSFFLIVFSIAIFFFFLFHLKKTGYGAWFSLYKQEGHDGPVWLHWLICKIPSYQTLQYLGTGLKHKTPKIAGWLVVWGFNFTLTARVIYYAVRDAYVFPGFLTPVLTQLFFPKPPTTFPTCICRDERWKYAGKKSCLNPGSN